MKKLIFSVALATGLTAGINAKSNFQLDEKKLAAIEMQCVQVGADEIDGYLGEISGSASLKYAPEQTRGGYLLRAFFCGSIALHRYYMGTNKKGMWAMYLCIPVVGGVNACVDFWGAVFDKDFYLKYKNNDKYIVWMD
ncbi:MAG: hypothetical protein OHK0036_14260 [Bacteroidia bacterium]